MKYQVFECEVHNNFYFDESSKNNILKGLPIFYNKILFMKLKKVVSLSENEKRFILI